MPIGLGPKRLSSEMSSVRNGLLPKGLVTRTEMPRIPESTFVFGAALCLHNLNAVRVNRVIILKYCRNVVDGF